MNTGEIRNREFARQIISFNNMKWGNGSPTNIDGFIEFGDRIFIFIEIKHGDSPLPFGQELALERLVNAVGKEKSALLVIGRHDCREGEDVDMASCFVTKYKRGGGEWFRPREMTVRKLIDIFISKERQHEKDGISFDHSG